MSIGALFVRPQAVVTVEQITSEEMSRGRVRTVDLVQLTILIQEQNTLDPKFRSWPFIHGVLKRALQGFPPKWGEPDRRRYSPPSTFRGRACPARGEVEVLSLPPVELERVRASLLGDGYDPTVRNLNEELAAQLRAVRA